MVFSAAGSVPHRGPASPAVSETAVYPVAHKKKLSVLAISTFGGVAGARLVWLGGGSRDRGWKVRGG